MQVSARATPTPPQRRFGSARHFSRPAFDRGEAAINQIRELGLRPEDVRRIVVTHFDVDHVGGAADFPWAQVHLSAGEAAAVTRVEADPAPPCAGLAADRQRVRDNHRMLQALWRAGDAQFFSSSTPMIPGCCRKRSRWAE